MFGLIRKWKTSTNHSVIQLFSDSVISHSVISHSVISHRAGFTLIELMVVVGMIAVLMGAMGMSVTKARNRARISKAVQETKEMTNAILAFEQYAVDHSLEQYAKGGWQDCTEGNMAMILGKVSGENGQQVPVLYNASITGGRMLDPWGRPYQFMIEKTSTWAGSDVPDLQTAPALPNYFRLTDKEKE